jgi:hypothetical protein|tara:strand:+ start:8259 stop:8480 length:222 start_codon:yes stop_codon:yes gene_type:complete
MPKIDEFEAYIYCPSCEKHVGELRRQSLEDVGGSEGVCAHKFIPTGEAECDEKFITNVKCTAKDVTFERSTTK